MLVSVEPDEKLRIGTARAAKDCAPGSVFR